MSDKFVTTPSEHFVEGQTVVAKVTNVDESKQRMLLSLRLSDCSLGDTASTSFLLLCQCLEELQGIRSLMSNQGGACLWRQGPEDKVHSTPSVRAFAVPVVRVSGAVYNLKLLTRFEG